MLYHTILIISLIYTDNIRNLLVLI